MLSFSYRSFLFLLRIESSFSSIWINDLSIRFLLCLGRFLYLLLSSLVRRFRARVLTGWRTFISLLCMSFLMILINNILIFKIAFKNVFFHLTLLQARLFQKFFQVAYKILVPVNWIDGIASRCGGLSLCFKRFFKIGSNLIPHFNILKKFKI